MKGFVCDIDGSPLRCGLSRSDDTLMVSALDLAAINGDAKLHEAVTKGTASDGSLTYPALARRGRLTYPSAPTTQASRDHADILLLCDQQLMLVDLFSIVDHINLYTRVHNYALLVERFIPRQASLYAECDSQIGLLYTVGREADRFEGDDSPDWVTYRSDLAKRRWRRPTDLISR